MASHSIGIKGKVKISGAIVTKEEKEKLKALAHRSGMSLMAYVNCLTMDALENEFIIKTKVIKTRARDLAP